jgi:hypothetical protein
MAGTLCEYTPGKLERDVCRILVAGFYPPKNQDKEEQYDNATSR